MFLQADAYLPDPPVSADVCEYPFDDAYISLTLFQKQMLKVSGDPELLSQIGPEAPPPLSLINDRSSAPGDQSTENTTIPLESLDVIDQVFGYSSCWDSDLPSALKRSLLKSHLHDLGLKYYNFNYWKFMQGFKAQVAYHGDIVNTDWQPFRKYNFDNCFKKHQKGNMHHFATESGEEVMKVQKMSCGNKYCPYCMAKKRQAYAADYVTVAKEAYEKYGMKKIWSIVFTLPRDEENSRWTDRLKLRNDIVKICKKSFGLRTRDNLGVLVSDHPVGDNDIMRRRLHWHVLIFPLVISKVAGVTYIDKDSLDISQLQKKWHEAVGSERIPLRPQVKYFDLTSPEIYGKIGHRFKYDLRSFSDTVINSVVVHAPDLNYVVLKAINEGSLGWRFAPMEELARQYVWVLQNSHIQPYGWLQKLNHWRQEGFFESKKISEPEKATRIDTCDIEIIREKAFSSKMGKVVWVRKEFCFYLGIKYEIGKDIRYV